MPSRILREGILTSDRVNSLTPPAEVFYRRLMSVVDDYGRFDGRPGLLRVSCFPLRVDTVREADISRWIAECVTAGLIALYAVDGKAFLEMQDFKQQVRAKSKYPGPVDGHLLDTSQADAKQMLSRLTADVHLGVVGDEGEGGVGLRIKPTALSTAKLPTCDYDGIIDLYHAVLPEMPGVRLMNQQRKRALQRTWMWVLTSHKQDHTRRATNAEEARAWFKAYFERARDNDFLMGRTPRSGEHAGWKCDLDFLLTDKGMKQVIEKTGETA